MAESDDIPKIFLSHSAKDEAFTDAVVSLLRSAFRLARPQIRCSSLSGHRFSSGSGAVERMRIETTRSAALILLLTEESRASEYVLFELGARWGVGMPCFIILGPGVDPGQIPAPIKDLQAAKHADAQDLLDLIGEVGKAIGYSLEEVSEYMTELTRVGELADTRDDARANEGGRSLESVTTDDGGISPPTPTIESLSDGEVQLLQYAGDSEEYTLSQAAEALDFRMRKARYCNLRLLEYQFVEKLPIRTFMLRPLDDEDRFAASSKGLAFLARNNLLA